ncbi:hypothetical protein [Rhodococcus marinonascens]|uniref:hypothetical protein n=1 Tax=Rhodococcus marinonascens TaxID=38311 RepID=UPI0011146F5C|nr:hypothetical protein [Rhodococcus marinonascens]
MRQQDEPEPNGNIPDLGGAQKEDVGHLLQEGETYDPSRHRENMRGWLAVLAFGLFAALVAFLAMAVVFGWRDWDQLEGVTTALLPVVVGVVGTTTGFYFGSRSSE